MTRRRLKPRNDFIFKKLFGETETKEILIHLLNAVLYPSGMDKIVDLTIIDNKELTKEMIDDKTGRLDIRAETDRNEQINVEVQLSPRKHMDKRTLFYLGKMFVESIKAGGAYGELKKTVTINILDFTYLNTARFHSSFHLYEDFDKTVMLTDVIEIHFIEYPKFRRSRKDVHNPLHRWLLFLDEKLPEDQLEELMSMDPVIKKAEERLEWLSSDEDTLRLYEAREFSRYERNSLIADAKEEGREEGREQGREEGKKEIARKLLVLGVDLQKITEATGLSEEEIKKL